MPKLPILSGKEVIKALSKIGYRHIRTSGSHAILTKQDSLGKKTVPVPLYKEVAKGTLKSIMRQTDIDLERLLEILK